MDKLIPRKYNNPVTIGLAVALVAAIGVAIYYYMKEPSPQKLVHPSHTTHTTQHVHPPKPEHVETKIDGNKPALVLVWAEWCGPSQHFKPIWDKIAAHLSKEGAIDAVEISDGKNKDEINKLHSKGVFKGFPSVLFYPEGYSADKKSVGYEGNRTEEGVLQFAYQAYQQAGL
jgi:thiol-disulfide isomerase/thioredoxin